MDIICEIETIVVICGMDRLDSVRQTVTAIVIVIANLTTTEGIEWECLGVVVAICVITCLAHAINFVRKKDFFSERARIGR